MAKRARQTIVQRIALDGGKQIEAEFKALGKAGEEAFAKLKEAADKANNISPLAARVAALKAQFQSVKGAGADFAAAVGTVVQRIGVLGTALTAAGGAFGLFAKGGAEAGAELDDFSQKVGVSARELQALQGAARVQGTGPEALQKALVKLSDDLTTAGQKAEDATKQIKDGFIASGGAIREFGSGAQQAYKVLDGASVNVTRFGSAASDALKTVKAAGTGLTEFGTGAKQTYQVLDGASVSITRFGAEATDALKQLKASGADTDKAAAAYKRLGINLEAIKAKSGTAGTLFLDLADAFAKIDDGAEKTALAVAIFGERIGPNLIPALNAGRKGVDQYRDTLKKFGFDVTDAGVKAAGEFGDSVDTLLQVLSDFRLKVGTLFAPLGTKLFQGLLAAFEKFGPQLVSLTDAVISKALPYVDALLMMLSGESLRGRPNKALEDAFNSLMAIKGAAETVATSFGTAWDIIASKVETLVTVANVAANAINGIFGTELTGASVVIFLAITRLTGGFTALWASGRLLLALFKLIAPVLLGIAGFITGLNAPIIAFGALLIAAGAIAAVFWDDIKAGFSDALEYVKGLFSSFGDALKSVWTTLGSALTGMWDGIGAAAKTALDGVLSIANNILGTIKGLIDGVISAATRAASAVASVFSGEANGGGGTDAMGSRFASGGHVRGRGTSTSDSIPAWLSNGEFVVRAAAVKKYGLGLLQSINGLSAGGFKMGMPAFAGGGLVGSLPSLASASPSSIVNLTIGTETFAGLRASDDVAERLARYAAKRVAASAGKRPSWVGG